MENYEVLIVPDLRLRKKAAPVTEINQEIKGILAKMLQTMYEEDGVGLAATQVGIDKRLLVIDLQEDGGENPQDRTIHKMINPEIVHRSDATMISPEACLSVPGQSADVKRLSTVTVKYTNEAGDKVEIEASNLMAACLQHEIDHLDGILYIDHLSAIKRKLFTQRAIKFVAKRKS